MQQHKSKILLVVFVLLLGLAYLLRNPEVLPTSKKTELVFPDFNKDSIEKIEIEKALVFKNVLLRKDDKWVVENEDGFPADENLVENVLATVSKLQKDELVGRSKANHAKFGVDKGPRTRDSVTVQGKDQGNQGGLGVKLSGDGKSYELIVGGRGPGFSSSYFRRAGEDEVYLAKQDLDLVFGESDYRDLRLGLKVQGSKLKAIKIENKQGPFELEKKDKWVLTKPEKKDDIAQSRVEDLISRLTTLEAVDATISAELSETGFGNPAVTVKIVGENGEDELIIGNENDSSQRYGQVSTSPYIYLLSPSDYGTLEELDLDYFTEEDSP